MIFKNEKIVYSGKPHENGLFKVINSQKSSFFALHIPFFMNKLANSRTHQMSLQPSELVQTLWMSGMTSIETPAHPHGIHAAQKHLSENLLPSNNIPTN